jgi:excisionase family DNA binding protein
MKALTCEDYTMLSRHEAAGILGISDKTLDRLTSAGEIKSTNIGKRVLYTHAALRKFIKVCQRRAK